MPRKTTAQIREELDDTDIRAAAEELYALAILAGAALPTRDYALSPEWELAVVPTPAGHALLNSALADGTYPHPVAHFALFEIFSHDELLIDLQKSDRAAIRRLISDDLRRLALLQPYRFGRLLYDKFNSDPNTSALEHLDPDQTLKFLEGTPQGVYQLGRILAGPLGLLDSATRRFSPPTRNLPLWHCSDTGCNAVHHVDLLEQQGPLQKIFWTLTRHIEDEMAPSSDWGITLTQLQRDSPQGEDYYDLLPTLADALTEDERAQLLLRLLTTSTAQTLRSTLALADKDTKRSRGAPQDIVRQLSDTERLQLILTLPNAVIVQSVDRLIFGDIIRVPIHEVRRSKFTPPSIGYRDVSSEISSLGIRPAHEPPILNLVSQVWRAYDESGTLEELGWKLRRQSGVPQRSALLDRLRTSSPQDAVRDLVLSSMQVTNTLSRNLNLDLDIYQESVLLDAILWKIGFDVPRFEHTYALARQRLQDFRDILFRVGKVRSESDRSMIRATGVNLFVSIESILEELVAYNVWLLASDHFAKTGFVYRPSEALATVSRIIGKELRSGDTSVSWSDSGQNTLGTLAIYLEATAKWIKNVSSSPTDTLKRPDEQMPHYVDFEDRPFPFRHFQMWADADRSALQNYAVEFGRIVSLISEAQVAAVRNGIDHKRGDDTFPTIDQMLLCEAKLREALDKADVQRFLPKSFWVKEMRSDKFGRIDYYLEDYRGRELVLSGPSVVVGLRQWPSSEAMLVAPANLLAESSAELRFQIKPSSSYAAYWSGYPGRRPGHSPHRADSARHLKQVDIAVPEQETAEPPYGGEEEKTPSQD